MPATLMSYSEFEPAPELKPWVASYWSFSVQADAKEIEHWIPLTGGVLLAFPLLGPPGVSGPSLLPMRTLVRGGDVFKGVHFWPGAAASLLGPSLDGLRDRHELAASLLDVEWLNNLQRRLANESEPATTGPHFDAALLPRITSATPLDPVVMTAVFCLIASHGLLRIQDLADELGISSRQLRRRFRAVTELAPKELARIQRIRSSAVEAVVAGDQRWVDLAASGGFADQAHLVREFRQILGLTPLEFRTHARRIDHGSLIR
ncbi:MAG: helix-turn-helix transcriptional regulator [Thermoanaerobaculia bacterium]|nr:helix-turn-helix transcriptional regulator [Thermoanaerobaculia bacterium]